MSNEALRIGVLGTASFALRSIIPTLLQMPEQFSFAGVASRDGAKAREATTTIGGKAYDGYDALIDDASIDAVYVPLPNGLHFEWVGRAIDRGLHVLVEKSLACTHDEVAELNKRAKDAGVTLMENFQFRFHSQLARIQQLLAVGAIGELRSMRSSFGFPPFPDSTNIRYRKELGGGALLDAGAYTVKVSQIFLGPDLDVPAAVSTVDPRFDVDVAGGGFLKQRNGDLFSSVAYGFDHFYQCGIELWGSKGRIHTNRIFTAPPTYVPEVTVETQGHTEVLRLESDDHFRKMLRHFHVLASDPDGRKREYDDNINQARLLSEMKRKAHAE